MVRSFSSVFALAEPLLGFAELTLQVTDSAMKPPKVLLGCQVKPARRLLEPLVERAFDAPAQTERSNGKLLHPRIPHELGHPWILHELDHLVAKGAHLSR